MKQIKPRAYLLIALLCLFIGGLLPSCSSTAPQTGWMDLPHARELDKKKGKKLKKLQKNVAHSRHH